MGRVKKRVEKLYEMILEVRALDKGAFDQWAHRVRKSVENVRKRTTKLHS